MQRRQFLSLAATAPALPLVASNSRVQAAEPLLKGRAEHAISF